MIITINYASGNPSSEDMTATTIRTMASGSTFVKEGGTRQIKDIDVKPATLSEQFTLEVRPGSGISAVQANVLEGNAAATAFQESAGGSVITGSSVLHETNATADNFVKLRLRTPPDLESAVARPADAPEDDLVGIGPALIVVKVRVRHP